MKTAEQCLFSKLLMTVKSGKIERRQNRRVKKAGAYHMYSMEEHIQRAELCKREIPDTFLLKVYRSHKNVTLTMNCFPNTYVDSDQLIAEGVPKDMTLLEEITPITV